MQTGHQQKFNSVMLYIYVTTLSRICVVPRTHNIFGHRSFSVAGPREWNAMPSHLRRDMN